MNNLTRADAKLKAFSATLENVYDHFEVTKQLPVIMTDSKGGYVFDGLSKKVQVIEKPVEKTKRVYVARPHRTRNITNVADAVTVGAQFPGGGESFLKYLGQMGKALKSSLPPGVKKANVVVEFIVDVDGVPTNFKVVQGVDDVFNDEVISVLEQMPLWSPAILNDKPVAKKIKQTFVVE